MRAFCLLVLLALPLQGCLAGMAISAAGDVAEGAVNTSIFAVKTTGRAAGAVIPGGGKDDEDE